MATQIHRQNHNTLNMLYYMAFMQYNYNDTLARESVRTQLKEKEDLLPYAGDKEVYSFFSGRVVTQEVEKANFKELYDVLELPDMTDVEVLPDVVEPPPKVYTYDELLYIKNNSGTTPVASASKTKTT